VTILTTMTILTTFAECVYLLRSAKSSFSP
jgi:hypothetical protein